jgi:hypothetical protein
MQWDCRRGLLQTRTQRDPFGRIILGMLGPGATATVFFPMSMSSLVKFDSNALKGPKLEIFDSGVFTQIRPVWVGDLGTTLKTLKSERFWLKNRRFVFLSAVGDSA